MNTTNPLIPIKNLESIEKIDGLIEICIDASKGFFEAASRLDDPMLSAMFHEQGGIRAGFAKELQAIIYANGERPETTGTTLGTAHRWWLELRAQVAPGDELPILTEAERGEDAILHRYEEAMKMVVGEQITEILMRQCRSIKDTHDRINALRERARLIEKS